MSQQICSIAPLADVVSPNSFRPMCLTSFMMKTLVVAIVVVVVVVALVVAIVV